MASPFEQLLAFVDALKRELTEKYGTPSTLPQLLGEEYVDRLHALSRNQAVKFLRTVGDAELLGAYLVLSKRLAPSVLAKLCTEFIEGESAVARELGIREVGTWLYATRHRRLSKTLAGIARDTSESPENRLFAFMSLRSINASVDETAALGVQSEIDLENPIEAIDWDFVDFFIEGKK